jgi:hypothetical protein
MRQATDYLCYSNTNNIVDNTIVLFLVICFWSLTAFRSINIGNDTSGYVRIFKEIVIYGLGANSRIEIGYRYLCLLFSKISADPHIFLIIYFYNFVFNDIYLYS